MNQSEILSIPYTATAVSVVGRFIFMFLLYKNKSTVKDIIYTAPRGSGVNYILTDYMLVKTNAMHWSLPTVQIVYP